MLPFTVLFDFECVTDYGRSWVMHELAQLGAKHLVLSNPLISMTMRTPELLKKLQAEMAQEGLTFVDAHSPFGRESDLLNPYEESRPRMVELHRLAMRIAADFGVDTICIHTGNPNWFDTKRFPLKTSMENICRALEKLLPFAEELGMTICIENIWTPTTTPEQLLAVKAQFPTDALGFTYDAGHANLMAQGRQYDDSEARRQWPAEEFPAGVPWDEHILEKMLPHVVNCHLHDNFGQWDEHRCPGHGNIDWPHILGLLKQAPRLKNLQSEVIPARTREALCEIIPAFRQRFAAVGLETD